MVNTWERGVAMPVPVQLCTGCARDALDQGGAYGPGDIIKLVDQGDCQCSDPRCDHVDHAEDSEQES